MRPYILALLLLLSFQAHAGPNFVTNCLSPVAYPFEASESFEVENLDSRKVGIFGYLTGAHKSMLKTAQASISSRPIVQNGCTKSSSLVLFMEPVKYSKNPCAESGTVFHRDASIPMVGENSQEAAMEMATEWLADTLTEKNEECPSTCSRASTTKLSVVNDELYIQSAMKCVPKRTRMVSLVHTAFLHEWTCDH